MKQYLDSNSKIKYFLLSTIFSILFIFTALYNPIVAHAEGEGLGSVPNGSGVNAQEVDCIFRSNGKRIPLETG